MTAPLPLPAAALEQMADDALLQMHDDIHRIMEARSFDMKSRHRATDLTAAQIRTLARLGGFGETVVSGAKLRACARLSELGLAEHIRQVKNGNHSRGEPCHVYRITPSRPRPPA